MSVTVGDMLLEAIRWASNVLSSTCLRRVYCPCGVPDFITMLTIICCDLSCTVCLKMLPLTGRNPEQHYMNQNISNVHLYDCDSVHLIIKEGTVFLDNLIDFPLSVLKSLYPSLKSGTFSWKCEIIHFKCFYMFAGSVEQLLLLPLSSWKGLWKQRNRK